MRILRRGTDRMERKRAGRETISMGVLLSPEWNLSRSRRIVRLMKNKRHGLGNLAPDFMKSGRQPTRQIATIARY